MIRKIRLSLYAVITLLWTATPAVSHEGHEHQAGEHSHKAPHGGMVVTVGKYHYEMVVEPQAVQVYLLDEQEKTLPIAGITGSVTLQVPSKGNKTVALSPFGDHFSAAVDLKGVEKFVAVVSLKIEEKTQVGRFSYRKSKEKHTEEEHHEEGGHKEHAH